MNTSKFNHECLTDILTKTKNENKNIILMGDFSVNLINYYKNSGAYEFQAESFKASNHSRMPPHTPKNLEELFFAHLKVTKITRDERRFARLKYLISVSCFFLKYFCPCVKLF